MDQSIARKLQQVGLAFHLPGPFFSYDEITIGNVNQTYKVNYIADDGSGMAVIKSYLVQRLNTYAFRNPEQVMDNIDRVTEHIREKRPNELCLHFHHTEVNGERKTFLMDDGVFWRVENYIPSVTFDTCDDLHVVRSAGEAFGEFQTSLSDFDASTLYQTIPDFHDTEKRYIDMVNAIQQDPLGRAKEVEQEFDFLMSVKGEACLLTDLFIRNELPLRVTHNDTKINNVLFDPDTRDALIVVDLDTVMPGLVGHDFGDAVRFAANFVEEDSREPERAGVNLNVFWAFCEGFLSRTAKALTSNEVNTLAQSCFCLSCELAARFLTDYVLGDKYFKINSPDHNLVRTRCQIALAKDMREKLGAMDAIVRQCANKYRMV